MTEVKSRRMKMCLKAVIVSLLTAILLSNAMLLSIHLKNPATEQLIEENPKEGAIPDDIPSGERATRSDNPYTSNHLHPINATDNDGFYQDHINLDEDAPGDGVYENTGKDSTYAWIECSYGPLNIPVGSIINNMTIYIGYYNDIEWNISASHTGIIWSTTSGGTEQDIADYTLSTTDRDEVYIITGGLPTASELNDGILIRVSGHDISGVNDVLHLDYLYFTINYSIPNIVINEVMFDPAGSDNNSEWVELYNAEAFSVDLTGWVLTDNDGNSFVLTGAGILPSGGHLVCHLAKSGTNSTTDVFSVIETVFVIQPNTTAGKDTYVKSDDPTSNAGSEPDVIVENTLTDRNILIQFDISNLPSNEFITSAEVFLYRFDGNDNDATVRVHRITQSWTESGATWNTSDGTNSWASAGGDFDGTVWDSATITGKALEWYSWDITNLTKSWNNNTYNNDGMLFESTGGSVWKGLYSSDYTDDTNLTPKLVVEYSNYAMSMLDPSDALALVDSNGNIVDYIAWGADAGFDDDDAVFAGRWDNGDYIDTSQILEGQTLGRDMDSNDTDQPGDWQNATGVADPYGVDRNDMYGPSPGEANIESVQGVPKITGVSSNPPTQYTGGYVNLTCNVNDPVGLYGVWMNITLPGGGYSNNSMAQGPGDQWYYNNTYLTLGIHQYSVWANNTNNNWSSSPVFGFTISNANPSLSNPIVTPILGYIDSWFNFTVSYSHLLNKAPDLITLNLTGPTGGMLGLMEVDSSDTDYTDGKLFYYNVSGLAMGSYSFHFAANDTDRNWAETAELPGPQVLNSQPTLLLPEVVPLSGSGTTYFNFTVTYIDLDNHPPDNISLNLTGPSGGIFDLVEVNISDMDYTDGKLYYYNISGLTVGSYSFHFSANDTMGHWALDTPEIDAPVVLQISATLTALDETVEYSDVAYLNATLFQNGTPVAGEDVAFYIDINDNGVYEPGELVGSGATLPDGIVSVIYTTYLSPGTYDYTAIYIGSGGFDVEDSFALLTINAKPAALTAQNRIVEEDEVVTLNATLLDAEGNPVADEPVEYYLDKNKNGIFEGGELIGSDPTSPIGIASFGYTANLAPGNYVLWARYRGSGNYSVTEIEGMLVVQNTGNTPPTILGVVPNQIKPEDSQPWTLDLTSYEADIEDSGADLKWYITGIDTSIYLVTGHNSTDDVFTFIPVENAFGNDEVTVWLVDSSGDSASQVMWVNITPVNDLPYFDPLPPNVFVHYDDPLSSDDDPEPWNYTFYVHDIETALESLVIMTSEPAVDSGEGYADVNGLEVTYHYPYSRLGESILVTLTLHDGTYSMHTVIMVNVTSEWVPELVINLPDITIEENTTTYSVFDLDDYFTDRDHDSLFFSSGYFHLSVVINEDNTVDITPQEQWTGSELVTFRATDPTGAIVEDTITVTVVPVNDGPVISGAPNLVVHYDYSYGFDFWPYIQDPDNELSELTLYTSEPTDNIWIQHYNNLGVVVNYPESMNGLTIPVTIYVSDGIETASQEIQITVSDDFPPELLYKIPDVSFDEDTVLEDYLLLSYYFVDPDGDALYFTNGTRFINALIDRNLTVDFSAPPNWHGYEYITFRATDPTGALAEDKILVVVVPVNDAPTLANIPRQEKNEGGQWVLDLTQYIDDVDNDLSELEITMESEAGQGYIALVGNILVFQYPKGVKSDIVTITVSDGELETTKSFTVTLQSAAPVAPSIWDTIPWPWVFLVSIAAMSGAFAFIAKKRKYNVYEAFLIHEKGLPIAHASREESSELEDVVVSGMFTAVQDFISDAFSGKTQDDGWKLDEMKFGENKILIERSQDLYLAAIFEGNGSRLGNRVRRLLKDIEEKYNDVFTDWDGDMTQLVGISSAINALIPKKPSKHVESEQTSAKDRSENEGEESEGPLTETEDLEERSSHEEITSVEGDKNSLSELEEIFDCPECYSQVRSVDIRCPICGVEFSETEGVDSELSGDKEGSEKNDFMNEGKENGDDIREGGDDL